MGLANVPVNSEGKNKTMSQISDKTQMEMQTKEVKKPKKLNKPNSRIVSSN